MAQNRSQVYTVDERYKESKGASDNSVALGFLKKYASRDKAGKRSNVEQQRREDDRFINAVPLANSNAYGSASFKNQFVPSQKEEANYKTIEQSEKEDQFKSLGEVVDENIRSIYDRSATYVKDPRREFYST